MPRPACIEVYAKRLLRERANSVENVGLVMVIVVTFLSPGAIRGTIDQFIRPDAASVATTADRTADYDAIRPDLWTHLLLGRGYGTYDPATYRILDSSRSRS